MVLVSEWVMQKCGCFCCSLSLSLSHREQSHPERAAEAAAVLIHGQAGSCPVGRRTAPGKETLWEQQQGPVSTAQCGGENPCGAHNQVSIHLIHGGTTH